MAADPSTEHFEYRARSGKVYQCLEHLEPARRSCILHAYVDGLSHSEIAQKLGTRWGLSKPGSNAASRHCVSAWHDPEELNDLAGEYVLGTLAAEQRLHVQQRLEHDAPLRAAVEAWEQRLLPLTELAEPVAPSPLPVAAH